MARFSDTWDQQQERNHAECGQKRARRLATVPLSPLAARYDQFILDLDGCVWVGGVPTPGIVEALEALRQAEKGIAFATNNAYESGRGPGGPAVEGRSARFAAGHGHGRGAMQHVLAETRTGRTAFVIGTPAMLRHVSDAGLKVLNDTDLASRAEVVVVAGTTDLVYDDLRNAVQAVLRGADLLATARDPTYPQPDGHWPGTGAVLAAVEYATKARAELVGNPSLNSSSRPSTGSARAARWSWAIGSTPTWRPPRRRASTPPTCSAAGGSRAALDGFEPRPVAVGETLAELLVGPSPPH